MSRLFDRLKEYQKTDAYRINRKHNRHKKYHDRKAAGLCVMCGKESRPGKTYCRKCRDLIKRSKAKKEV